MRPAENADREPRRSGLASDPVRPSFSAFSAALCVLGVEKVSADVIRITTAVVAGNRPWYQDAPTC